jgi:hypothetical protein
MQHPSLSSCFELCCHTQTIWHLGNLTDRPPQVLLNSDNSTLRRACTCGAPRSRASSTGAGTSPSESALQVVSTTTGARPSHPNACITRVGHRRTPHLLHSQPGLRALAMPVGSAALIADTRTKHPLLLNRQITIKWAILDMACMYMYL